MIEFVIGKPSGKLRMMIKWSDYNNGSIGRINVNHNSKQRDNMSPGNKWWSCITSQLVCTNSQMYKRLLWCGMLTKSLTFWINFTAIFPLCHR